jgi:hypothetical protein
MLTGEAWVYVYNMADRMECFLDVFGRSFFKIRPSSPSKWRMISLVELARLS